MNKNDISNVVNRFCGSSVVHLASMGGGSISSVYKASLENGRSYCIKTDPHYPDMFVKEGHGLQELQKANAITIPDVIYADESVLITELLPASSPNNRKKYFEDFGRQFARLHRYHDSSFGFYEDNYIGSTRQQNSQRLLSWKEFYWVHRLEFQFHLAEQNGHGDPSLTALFRNLERRIDTILPDDGEPPALLHGDLWSGNFLCLENDIPAVIDPAVYYGHREADLGMTMLFGGFDQHFYASYNEQFPLTEGWLERMELYKLYHLLNHLNIFGEGYLQQVVGTMRSILSMYR